MLKIRCAAALDLASLLPGGRGQASPTVNFALRVLVGDSRSGERRRLVLMAYRYGAMLCHSKHRSRSFHEPLSVSSVCCAKI